MPIAGAGAGLHGWHLSEFRALGGIGEGFVSRLGAQGLPCVGGPRWLRGFGVVQNRRLARICGQHGWRLFNLCLVGVLPGVPHSLAMVSPTLCCTSGWLGSHRLCLTSPL